MRSISTVIIKPTKVCNADCSYCCAPPDGAPRWTITEFTRAFDALEPRLHPSATLIWHGGEPMLLGPEFYARAFSYAKARLPHLRFSIQSNLLSYNERWRDIFRSVFAGSISTSWDPDELCRTVKGSTELYSRLYHDKIRRVLDDGFRPKIISTFSEETIHLAHEVYDRALAADADCKTHDIRLNYRYPAGRASKSGPAIAPATYGRILLEIYERWISDTPNFLVTPLDQMFLKVIGDEAGRCPWSSGCTGKIIGLEPNFDVYNCGEFADLGEDGYRFGNLLDDGIDHCLASPAARSLAMRRLRHPESCKTCIHFTECEGGCMRDSALFERGIYGKFFYCESWQEVFSRIKESIISGEADAAIAKFGRSPEKVRSSVSQRLGRGISEHRTHMRRPVLSWGYVPDFETLHGPVDLN